MIEWRNERYYKQLIDEFTLLCSIAQCVGVAASMYLYTVM